MRKPSKIGSGLLLTGALAGAAFDADAQPSRQPEFSEVLPISHFQVQDQTLFELLKSTPEAVQNAYFLAIPLDGAVYFSQRDLQNGLIESVRDGEPRIGAKNGALYRAYDVYVFAGLTIDNLPVIKYVSSASKVYEECYIPTQVTGYWDYNGQRYYLTDLDRSQLSLPPSVIYNCANVQPYVPPLEEVSTKAQTAVEQTLAQAADSSVPAGEPTPAGEVVESMNSPHHLQAGLFLGGDVEQFSPASLGFGGTLRVQALYTLPNARIAFGLSPTFLLTREAAGWYGLNATGGYYGESFGVYLAPGIWFEPRRPETTLNGSFGVELGTTATLLSRGPLDIQCGVGIHTRFYGGAPTPGGNAFCGASWGLNVHREGSSAQAQVTVGGQILVAEENPLSIVKKEIPYTPNQNIPGQVGSIIDEGIAAEVRRLQGEMERDIQDNNWKGAEGVYQQFLEENLPMDFDVYWYGAYAARGLGDIEETYERLLRANEIGVSSTGIATGSELSDWLTAIENNYARVEMRTGRGVGEQGTLAVSSVPFATDMRTAIDKAQKHLAEDGSYEGFLPAFDGEAPIVYTYGGVEFTLEPIGPRGDQDGQKTQVIQLKKN